MKIAGPPEVAAELEDAIRRRGLRPRSVELVSPLRERKGMRFAYRVEGEDGGIVKARHFGTAENARCHFALRSGLEEAFAPALGVDGPVVFEAWIEGVGLTALGAEARREEAGALLGRLHARPLEPGTAAECATAPWRSAAESDLQILRRGDALAVDEAEALRDELLRRDPGSARVALIHKDFCAENMVIDAAGRLRVIDNEQIAIEPLGFDLGRTFHRWPMDPAGWDAFRRGHRSARPPADGATGFWRIVAALVGARVFLQRIPERLDDSIALLRRFVAGADLEEEP